jgi:hypothetical protein
MANIAIAHGKHALEVHNVEEKSDKGRVLSLRTRKGSEACFLHS